MLCRKVNYQPPRFGELVEETHKDADIVLDTPPLTPPKDRRLFGRWVDGCLVVVTAYRTPRW
jgi:Mrp family chromosome partitioning ATPase